MWTQAWALKGKLCSPHGGTGPPLWTPEIGLPLGPFEAPWGNPPQLPKWSRERPGSFPGAKRVTSS